MGGLRGVAERKIKLTQVTSHEYSLMGDDDRISDVVKKHNLRVTERFGKGDVNVIIPDTISDEVTTDCERYDITWTMM